MHGRIEFINPETRTGLIFGAEGSRYHFRVEEWHGPELPSRNQAVAFEAQGDAALAIHPAESVASHAVVPEHAHTSDSTFKSVAPLQMMQAFDPPGFWAFYFSLSGRVSVGQYWLRYFLPGSILYFVLRFSVDYLRRGAHPPPFLEGAVVLLAVFILPLVWVSFAVHLKRLHDLDISWKSNYLAEFMFFNPGWLVYRFTIPFKLLFAEGTPGDNSFGSDPRNY